jgi:hypothetical protein
MLYQFNTKQSEYPGADMEPVNIGYKLHFADRTEAFNYQLQPDTYEIIVESNTESSAADPQWVKLDHKKCAHCPLNSNHQPYCPLAMQLQPLVETLHQTSSIDEVELEMIRGSRRIIETTTLQEAVGSILEVIYPASGCPKTKLMRPQARFHIPSGSEEEKVYGITSMYMLAQYFRKKNGSSGDFDFTGLINFYSDMSVLNKALASRLTGVTRSDSVKNGITLMDMYSTLIPLMLEEDLVELRDIFSDFLPQQPAEKMAPIKNHVLERIKTAKLEIVPIEEDSADNRPDWLREVKGEQSENNHNSETPKHQKPALDATLAADAILKNSSLTLELVPTEDEGEEKPRTGKAIFKLPED